MMSRLSKLTYVAVVSAAFGVLFLTALGMLP